MSKPYIICHMMTSVDGRIDWTEQLPGVNDYYNTLNALETLTRLSGRVTAELEMALPGRFSSRTKTPLHQEAFYKACCAHGYEVIVDTQGSLFWKNQTDQPCPILVLTSEQVHQEYLDYLKEKHISWIACGKEQIDLKRACQILQKNLRLNEWQ